MADIELQGVLNPTGAPEIHSAKIGTDVSYTEIRPDGTQRLVGDATAWKDMVMDLFGKRLSSNTGKIDYDYNENAMKFQSGGSITNQNDRVGGNQQINHEFKVGDDIVFKPHIHWFQEVTGGVQKAFVLTMRYRLQRNNFPKTTAWTTVTCSTGTGGDDIFDFSGRADGTYNQLSQFPDIVRDCNVSDTIQMQVARTDSNSGDMLVYFLDSHGMVDSMGSDEEIAKAP